MQAKLLELFSNNHISLQVHCIPYLIQSSQKLYEKGNIVMFHFIDGETQTQRV